MSRFKGFDVVQLTRPQKSEFDLSHSKRLSTRMGRLTPVLIKEALPSDVFDGRTDILLRTAPLLAPIYDILILFVHFFFVPCRLLYGEWETFITGGRLGPGSADPVDAPIPPYFDIGEVLAGAHPDWLDKSSLADYLGVPIFVDLPGYTNPASYDDIHCDMMPFMAYQKVWYDYYRDRNFTSDDAVAFPLQSGKVEVATIDSEELLKVRTRSYPSDYYLTALPFTQRGAEVLMPLAGTGSVTYLTRTELFDEDGVTPMSPGALSAANAGGFSFLSTAGVSGIGQLHNIDEVLLESSSVSINDFRSAYALQVWAERNAIAGSRYVESSQAHFGVPPQDARLQNSEYLGGGRIVVQIGEVLSTAYSDDGEAIVPLANLAGRGKVFGNTNTFKYFCPEHGFIVGVASIMNERSYHQGLPRMFRRRTFLDYPWPSMAKLGEQQVDKAELFASALNLTENANGELPMFGYQSRYSDWKWEESRNHGDFHDSLQFWTLCTRFASSPVLGNEFVEFDDDSQDRLFAVNGSADNFWLYVFNNLKVRRPLPYFGVPNNLGFS